MGSNESLQRIVDSLHQRKALIALDVVVNHTSDEHAWAVKASQGEEQYQDYYYTFDNRDIPDMFEQSMPEVFPETDAGNFTWNKLMQKWVMTVFHSFV